MGYLIEANVAKIGKFSLKVLNSLIHTGPYIAVHIGKKRIAWLSFKDGKHRIYDDTTKTDLEGIELVEKWLSDVDNFNLAANTWNDFNNGVKVPLKTKETK